MYVHKWITKRLRVVIQAYHFIDRAKGEDYGRAMAFAFQRHTDRPSNLYSVYAAFHPQTMTLALSVQRGTFKAGVLL